MDTNTLAAQGLNLIYNTTYISSSTTLTGDIICAVVTATNDLTITLPPASAVPNRIIKVVIASGTGDVTIAGEGLSSVTITGSGIYAVVWSDGNNYTVMASNMPQQQGD